MEDQTYTVRDVAQMISGDKNPEAIERMVRKIRYWTNEGVVNPLGGKSTGSGNYRTYDLDEVRKAAIAAEMVRYGVSLEHITYFGRCLESLKNNKMWKLALKGEENVFLSHVQQFGSDEECSTSAHCRKGDAPDPLVLVSKRGKMIPSNKSSLDFDDFPSVLVVNITKLFARLGLGDSC